jgi:hypothetical protein
MLRVGRGTKRRQVIDTPTIPSSRLHREGVCDGIHVADWRLFDNLAIVCTDRHHLKTYGGQEPRPVRSERQGPAGVVHTFASFRPGAELRAGPTGRDRSTRSHFEEVNFSRAGGLGTTKTFAHPPSTARAGNRPSGTGPQGGAHP